MWNKIDIDSSGSITREEFRRAIDPYIVLVRSEMRAQQAQVAADDSDSEDGTQYPTESMSLWKVKNAKPNAGHNSVL
jgi:hypothetical protein